MNIINPPLNGTQRTILNSQATAPLAPVSGEFFTAAPGAQTTDGAFQPLLGKALTDLSSDELGQLGARSSLENLMNLQGDLTLGEVAPLLRNPIALDAIIDLMEQRPDLKLSHFLSQDINGNVSIDPSYKSGETMEFLKDRPDITPQEVSNMRDAFSRLFRNPMMGKWATVMSFDLMKQRSDLKPQDMTRMMESFGGAAGMGEQGESSNMPGSGSAGAALDMFQSASRLLVKRHDMQPERLENLARSVGALASPEDPSRGQRVAEGFDATIMALESNPLREPEEFSRLADVIGTHFQGKDPNSAAVRMNAFAQSAQMMGENPEINPDSIDSLLTAAKRRDPKNNQPRALGNALSGVFDGVNRGLLASTNLTSPFSPQAENRPRPELSQNGEEAKAERQERAQDSFSANSGPPLVRPSGQAGVAPTRF